MRKIKKILSYVGLIVALLFHGFLIYKLESIECYWSHSYPIVLLWFIGVIITSYFLYYFFKINTKFDASSAMALIVVLFTLALMYAYERMNKSIIDKRGGIMVSAVIYNKKNRKNSPPYIYIKTTDKRRLDQRLSLSFSKYQSIFVGDTIMVVYNEWCNYVTVISSFNPTSEQIKKCKDGCVYTGENEDWVNILLDRFE